MIKIKMSVTTQSTIYDAWEILLIILLFSLLCGASSYFLLVILDADVGLILLVIFASICLTISLSAILLFGLTLYMLLTATILDMGI